MTTYLDGKEIFGDISIHILHTKDDDDAVVSGGEYKISIHILHTKDDR